MKNLLSGVKIFLAIAIISTGCARKSEQFDAKKLKVRWSLLENTVEGKANFKSAFTLFNRSTHSLNSGWKLYFNQVASVQPASVTGNCAITHVNGDLYVLEPQNGFELDAGDSLKVEFLNSDWAINYSDAPSGLFFVSTAENGSERPPVVIEDYSIEKYVSERQTRRSADDILPVTSATVLYEKYSKNETIDQHELLPILPRPKQYKKSGKKTELRNLLISAPPELENEKKFLEKNLPALRPSSNAIEVLLSVGKVIGADHRGGYKLEIKGDRIKVTGNDKDGVFNGIQSLRQLILLSTAGQAGQLEEIEIVDFPGFEYRGVHLDVARNFQRKETILKFLDLMSFYKLNKFHFHLSDDEGWRLEIKKLPELTAFGSKRYYDPKGKALVPSFGSGPFAENRNGSGYYTQDDFIEILRYAKDRHIEVIPKIDMPGHARAAVKSMDQRYQELMSRGKENEAKEFLLRDLQDKSEYKSVQLWNDNVICVCQQSTYSFVETVVDELMEMYKEAGAPFTTFHIGADEVPHGAWEKSPACAQLMKDKHIAVEQLPEYFFERVSSMLSDRKLNMGGWEEIALKKIKSEKSISFEANEKFVNANFKPYVWNSVWGWDQEDVGYKLANAGYQVVLGNVTNLYFDLAYEKHPEEPGYYWGGFVDTKTVFSFVPYDLFINASKDKLGRDLNVNRLKEKVRLSGTAKRNILGIQGQLWAENLKGNAALEYMAFPKLQALAERAWSPSPAWADRSLKENDYQADWNAFSSILGYYHFAYLDQANVGYRISPPGAVLKDWKLYVNNEFPGFTIRYTTDGSEPDLNSEVYSGPITVEAKGIRIKAFNSTDRSSRTVVVN
jgi:hexosaminidase